MRAETQIRSVSQALSPPSRGPNTAEANTHPESSTRHAWHDIPRHDHPPPSNGPSEDHDKSVTAYLDGNRRGRDRQKGACSRSKQSELCPFAQRCLEQIRPQGATLAIETQPLARHMKAFGHQFRIGALAGMPDTETCIIILAVAGGLDERQNMPQFAGMMFQQPFPEKIAQFERQTQ